jgi:site-specific recombinase XerD
MELLAAGPAALCGELRAAAARAAAFAQHARAANTVRAYRADWDDFEGWCVARGLQALPAAEATLALYLTERAASRRVSTLQRRISAIAQAHRMAGHDSPLKGSAAVVWRGIRRTMGTAQRGKAPARTTEVRRMVATCGDSLLDARDRALVLLGFAGALRRSELVGLDVADLAFTTEGLVLTLRRSKTDQEGASEQLGIPYGSTPATCPVRALQAWLQAAGITEGAVFRAVSRWGRVQGQRLSAQTVARVVKRRAAAAGLPADRYAGHSLRAGLATAAAEAGVSERVIMAQTRHRSLPMVRRYIREGSLFRENAAARVGL